MKKWLLVLILSALSMAAAFAGGPSPSTLITADSISNGTITGNKLVDGTVTPAKTTGLMETDGSNSAAVTTLKTLSADKLSIINGTASTTRLLIDYGDIVADGSVLISSATLLLDNPATARIVAMDSTGTVSAEFYACNDGSGGQLTTVVVNPSSRFSQYYDNAATINVFADRTTDALGIQNKTAATIHLKLFVDLMR